MKIYSFTADKNYKHLYMFLKDLQFSESLISFLRSKAGRILINEQTANTQSVLKKGDIVKLDVEDDASTDLPKSDLKLDILFENGDLIAINKPFGISCIPSRSHYKENLANSVCFYMKDTKNFVYRILGRLDKDTSGVIIIAKNRLVAEQLKIEKTYIGLCAGHFPFENLEINLPISTISKNGVNQQKREFLTEKQKQKLLEEGFQIDEKPALTFVKKVKEYKTCTLLEFTLKTGRTHQIRLHMSAVGFPLLDDGLYGSSTTQARTKLHCKKAKLTLPIFQFTKTINTPIPTDFKKFLN